MIERRLVLVSLALLLGTAVGWYLAGGAVPPVADDRAALHDTRDDDDDDDDDVPVRQRLTTVDGEVRVRLTAEEMTLAGIRTALPAAAQATRQRPLAGHTLDTRELLAGQARLRAITRAASAHGAVIATLDARLARLAGGQRLGAQRDLAALELERARERARRDALLAERDAARIALEAAWGTTLVAQATADDGLARALLDGEMSLVGFTIAATAVSPPGTLGVSADGTRYPARSLGPAPAALPGLPGRGWFAIVEGVGWPAGMPVTVWTDGEEASPGVLVPPSAIVWDGDGAWLFQMTAPSEFVRRAVGAANEQPGGLLVSGIDPAIPIVIAGVQALQGERFRGAIPDEDED